MGCHQSQVAKPASRGEHQRAGKTLLPQRGAEAQTLKPEETADGGFVTQAPIKNDLAENPDRQHASQVAERDAPEATGFTGGDSDNVAEQAVRSQGVPIRPHSHNMLKKALTLVTNKADLDIMVVKYTAHDSTVGSMIGRDAKEVQWKVVYDRDAAPIDIKLKVQKHKVHYHEVGVESNGEQILTGPGADMAKMKADFQYKWPLRATLRGIGVENFFEVRPAHLINETWFPATLKRQHADGSFEVVAQEPNGRGGLSPVCYPNVVKENLREAATHKGLDTPEDFLFLDVPSKEPLNATLSMAGGDLVTHHFGRLSPPLGVDRKLMFQVSKDRSMVTANVGNNELSHFLSGEVRSVKTEAQRLKHSWTFQLGPFAEHTVEIKKNYTLGSIISLIVDGETLVEASAADLANDGKEWRCSFRFVGERIIDFEVFKTNVDGSPTNKIDHVLERRKYEHECTIVIPNEKDFRTAVFGIDKKHFQELTTISPHHEEKPLTLEPRALMHAYNISVPYKVDEEAPSNLAILSTGLQSGTGGLFGQCCNACGQVEDEKDLVVARD